MDVGVSIVGRRSTVLPSEVRVALLLGNILITCGRIAAGKVNAINQVKLPGRKMNVSISNTKSYDYIISQLATLL